LEHQNLDHHLFHLFGERGKRRGRVFIEKLEKRLGGWVRAEIVLMTFIGLLSYIGFVILGLDFALSLALLAGILELVPNIGPVVAAIPATLFGFLASPLTGIATLSWCFIVQQIENNLLVPKVMKSAANVNPIITLLSLAVGFRLAGVAGALLAIPIFIVIELIISEFISPKTDHSIK
jgi:predicted PurR-regulated permease PerM